MPGGGAPQSDPEGPVQSSVTREEAPSSQSVLRQIELLSCAFVPLLSREVGWPDEERSEVQAGGDSSSSACTLVSESRFSTLNAAAPPLESLNHPRPLFLPLSFPGFLCPN